MLTSASDTTCITTCTAIRYRHWSPECESYSGGDSLLGALEDGWQLVRSRQITQRTHSKRLVTLYIVWLEKDGQLAIMRLIGNPYITRLLNEKQHLEIVSFPQSRAAANF